jgi:hypothetical protein
MLRRSTDRLHKKGASIQSEKCRIAPYQTVTVISTSVIMSPRRVPTPQTPQPRCRDEQHEHHCLPSIGQAPENRRSLGRE